MDSPVYCATVTPEEVEKSKITLPVHYNDEATGSGPGISKTVADTQPLRGHT